MIIMTKNTKTIENCHWCNGFGHVDAGCDDQTQMTCFACGGTGTLEVEASSAEAIEVDETNEANEAMEGRNWSVIRHAPVNGNAAAWARVAHGFTHEEAKAEVEAEIDLCDVIFEIPSDEVDAWFADNSPLDIEDYEDDILTDMGR